MKLLISLVVFCMTIFGFSFAEKYLYFHGDGCPHCAKVEEYFAKNDITDKFTIEQKEVYNNKANALIFSEYAQKLNIQDGLGVPFLVIMEENGSLSYKSGDTPIIEYFKGKVKQGEWKKEQQTTESETQNATTETLPLKKQTKIGLFIALITASLADSINPCVFAILLLLLSTILTKSKSRKKAVIAGLSFVLAIFLGYMFLGRLLLGLLATVGITNSGGAFWIQIIVGGLGVIVGLANLKDYFFPDMFPPMEVPLSWRPNMQKIVKGVLSPVGAFGIGLVLTMFLLPCTAGPYVTFLGKLASYPELQQSMLAYYIYLISYNIIFVLPMLIIIAIIGKGFKSVEELGSLRKKYRLHIHLIVGLLMLGLGIYVLIGAYA